MKTKWEAMMRDDPWNDITTPKAINAINAKRVDATSPWGFFWARGLDGKCLFVFQHERASSPTTRLPRLRGIEIIDSEWVDGDSRILIFELEDEAQRGLFCQLCLDIVACTTAAGTEQEAVILAIARTWRWHHLLRGGSDSRLSLEEQKGLIGELLFVERHLLANLTPADSISAWHGPLDSPKDFEVGPTCIEVKARRGAATPLVAISSESQLDSSGIGTLFLYVVDLDQAPSDSPQSFTLTDVAGRIREILAASDASATESYEGLLAAGGFRWSDDYSDTRWIEGIHRVHRVTEGFPRITTTQLALGVSKVRYSISLVSCRPFLVEVACLDSALRGNRDVL